MEFLQKHNSIGAERLSQLHMENTIINILKNVVVVKEEDKNKDA